MSVCPSCSAQIAGDAKFCSSCGVSLDVSSAGTIRRDSRPSSSGGIDHGRFLPGTMFGDRYRIVALLGKGGMGEVYRADDLKLNQPVALKFLPKRFGESEERRARLLGEVRVARQIAHPNVCRVYDVGEIAGEHFISMEYVQGEDLASLLHRIGRLPKDKGIEIARQVCSGLAAAHERGVLHRDLKPANIMLDERGRARVTDFGLASAAGDASTQASEGTPAYMAPEQLAGREVTVRSDIYSLGLVIYEIFTGKRAFSAATLADLREQRELKSLTDPSRIVEDIDPAVERAILRCLENDPRDRPPSVLALLASLPGGDPLAAAIAAGETPSPELLAAAGDSVGLKPSIAVPLLLFVILGSIAVALLKWRTDLTSYNDLDLPPEALEQKAREIARQFGYSARPADSAGAFGLDGQLISYIREHDRSADRWEQLRNLPIVQFWYRDSPDPLEWHDFFDARVTASDPPLERSGMKRLLLDASGRLLSFEAVPQLIQSGTSTPRPVDENLLFAAAGLEPARFKPAAPQWLPLTYADWRGAWEGSGPDGKPLRIEAATYQGRLVSFREVWPWTKPPGESTPLRIGQRVSTWIGAIVLTGILVTAVFFARRNLSFGRGDRRGAGRLALAVFVLMLAASLISTSHLATASEVGVVVQAISWSLFVGMALWLLYLACEPYVRRRWPHALIGLGKVLAGRLRDPLVGRDVLIGSAAGVAVSIFWTSTSILARLFGGVFSEPRFNPFALSGLRYAFAQVLTQIVLGVWFAFFGTMLVLVLRILLRREWLAIAVLLGIVALQAGFSSANVVLGILSEVVAWGLLIFVLARLGLIAALCVVTVSSWLPDMAVAAFGGWSAYTVWLPLLATLALATCAFYVALAGRPLLRDALLET